MNFVAEYIEKIITACINFLRAGLVDEIFLTVEPVTIGHGIRFLGEPLESRWILAGTKSLNKGGTIVLHYKKIAR